MTRPVTLAGRVRRPVQGAPGFEISRDATLRKHRKKVQPVLHRTSRRADPTEAWTREMFAAWVEDATSGWVPLDSGCGWDHEEYEEFLTVDLGMRYPGLPLLTASGRKDDSNYMLDEIVCLAFHGRPPRLDIADVLHLDYDQKNCAASNLEWAVDDVALAYWDEQYYEKLAKPEHCEKPPPRTKPDRPPRSLDTKLLTEPTNELPTMQPLNYDFDELDGSDIDNPTPRQRPQQQARHRPRIDTTHHPQWTPARVQPCPR
jgi:hypothetical protein